MQKCCGNCQHWTKLKSIIGLCEKYDLGWANSDHGADCIGWKRKRNTKPREKINVKLLEDLV